MSNVTEAEIIDRETTSYIQRNISKQFLDTWKDLDNRKVPKKIIFLGLVAFLTNQFLKTTELRTTLYDSPEKIAKVLDDIHEVIEAAIEKDMDYVSQAGALAMILTNVLGLRTENFLSWDKLDC